MPPNGLEIGESPPLHSVTQRSESRSRHRSESHQGRPPRTASTSRGRLRGDRGFEDIELTPRDPSSSRSRSRQRESQNRAHASAQNIGGRYRSHSPPTYQSRASSEATERLRARHHPHSNNGGGSSRRNFVYESSRRWLEENMPTPEQLETIRRRVGDAFSDIPALFCEPCLAQIRDCECDGGSEEE